MISGLMMMLLAENMPKSNFIELEDTKPLADHPPPRTPTEFLQRYLNPDADNVGGHYGIIVRRAFARATGLQRRKYHIIISGTLVLLVMILGVVIYQHFDVLHAMNDEDFCTD